MVGGPTATGKTDLAIEIALAIRASGRRAEVISADSRQVYRGLDIGTAKPTLEERRGVPHHGLDLVEPDEAFSVADFVTHASGVLAALAQAGGIAILAGGTGFWIAAVAGGLPVEQLPWDPAVRAMLEADLARDGLPALDRPPPADSRPRVPSGPTCATRGASSGRSRSPRLAGDAPLPTPRGLSGPGAADRPRRRRPRPPSGLDRAARRDPVRRRHPRRRRTALRARFDPGLPAFSGIGYREAWDLLDGRLDRAGYLAVNVRRNVAFARRQRTWFRARAGRPRHRRRGHARRRTRRSRVASAFVAS